MRTTIPSVVFFALSLLVATVCTAGGDSADAQLEFGVQMARRGLWSEALFRFQQAERLEPQSFRVYNNLAVAYEANGMFDRALDYYQRALKLAPDNRELRRNYSRFIEFYQSFKPRDDGEKSAGDSPPPDAAAAADAGEAAPGDG